MRAANGWIGEPLLLKWAVRLASSTVHLSSSASWAVVRTVHFFAFPLVKWVRER